MPKGLIFNLIDYIELFDWTGRVIRDDKRGAIPQSALPILQRLNISESHWITLTTPFEQRFKGIAGSLESIKKLCDFFGITRNTNRSSNETLYGWAIYCTLAGAIPTPGGLLLSDIQISRGFFFQNPSFPSCISLFNNRPGRTNDLFNTVLARLLLFQCLHLGFVSFNACHIGFVKSYRVLWSWDKKLDRSASTKGLLFASVLCWARFQID